MLFWVLLLIGGTDGLTGEGFDHAFGGGYRLGWQGKFMEEKLRLGINYSSQSLDG